MNGYCLNCGFHFKTQQTDPSRVRGPCPKCATWDRYEIKPAGLGDWIGFVLRCVGITKARWLALKSKMGLAQGCGCAQRQETLNKLVPFKK